MSPLSRRPRDPAAAIEDYWGLLGRIGPGGVSCTRSSHQSYHYGPLDLQKMASGSLSTASAVLAV